MAFNTKNVFYTLDALKKLPSGHSLDTANVDIGAVDISNVRKKFEISVGTIPNANKATAATAFDTALKSAIETYIGDQLAVDETGETVNYRYKVEDIKRGNELDDIFLIEANDTYFVTGVLAWTIV